MTEAKTEGLPVGQVKAPQRPHISFRLLNVSATVLLQHWRIKRFSISKMLKGCTCKHKQLCCQSDLQPTCRHLYLLPSGCNLTHGFRSYVSYHHGIHNVITPTCIKSFCESQTSISIIRKNILQQFFFALFCV